MWRSIGMRGDSVIQVPAAQLSDDTIRAIA